MGPVPITNAFKRTVYTDKYAHAWVCYDFSWLGDPQPSVKLPWAWGMYQMHPQERKTLQKQNTSWLNLVHIISDMLYKEGIFLTLIWVIKRLWAHGPHKQDQQYHETT